MRYDLEIQATQVGIIFVEQWKEIPSSSIPLLYANVNETNVIPADLVQIELASKFKSYIDIPVTQTAATQFIVESNKILMTTVARFSRITGSKIPVFFKHIISLTPGQTILDQSIRVFNELNIQLDSELMTIESGNNEIYVYMNPIEGSILTIEYGDQEKLFRELLKLEPAFKDVGSNYLTANDLKQDEYACVLIDNEFNVITNNSAVKFIAAKKDFASVMPPIGNISDPWYLRLENITINSISGSGVNTKYHLVEYDTRRSNILITDPTAEVDYIKYTDQIAQIIDGKFIKLQALPSKNKIYLINILIRDKSSNTLKYAFTTNLLDKNPNKLPEFTNGIIEGIKWTSVDDINYDGIIKLPISIDNTYVSAFVTYTVDNTFYEYLPLNLNAIDSTKAGMIALYMIPYNEIVDTSLTSVFFTLLGISDSRSNESKFMVNGAGFETKDDYLNFLTENNCINLCFTSVSVDSLHDMLDIKYCASDKEIVLNQYELAKNNMDLLKKDIIDGEIELSLNGIVYANIDSSVFSGDENTDNEYIKFAGDVINKNLCPSSSYILGKNLV